MKKILFSLLLFASFFAQGQKLQDLPTYNSNITGVWSMVFYETVPGNGVWVTAHRMLLTDILNPYVKKSDSSIYYTSRFAFQHWKDSVNTVIAAIPSLANYYTKTQADARYLQSFSETDPKRIVSVLVTGTNTKTVTITLADATTVTTTFTDQQGAGGGVSGNADSLGSHPAAYYAPLSSVTKTQVGLPNVDNTSDVNKPVSTATQTALNLKADASALAAKANQSALVDSATALRALLGAGSNLHTRFPLFSVNDSTLGFLTGYSQASSITSSSTITINADTVEVKNINALATNATIAAPTGTLRENQWLIIRIKDDGTPRTLTWNAVFRASTDFALPTTTVAGKVMYVQFIFNNADAAWDAVGYTKGF